MVEMQRTIPHDLIDLPHRLLANVVLVWRCTPHVRELWEASVQGFELMPDLGVAKSARFCAT
jgi:hypothetical protein